MQYSAIFPNNYWIQARDLLANATALLNLIGKLSYNSNT